MWWELILDLENRIWSIERSLIGDLFTQNGFVCNTFVMYSVTNDSPNIHNIGRKASFSLMLSYLNVTGV